MNKPKQKRDDAARFIEHAGCYFAKRSDGRVDCYSPSGYRIYEWSVLPYAVQQKLIANAESRGLQ